MTDYNYIENYITDFVDRHVSEKVSLSIKPKQISIDPTRKKGSILLAMFWIKILQHRHNFPPQSVSYNRKKIANWEIVFVLVEDVAISLNLLNGSLTIEGATALEWFRTRFIEIIRNFIGFRDTRRCYRDDQSIFDVTSRPYNHQLKSHLVPNDGGRDTTVLEDEHLSNLMVDSVLEVTCESVRQSSLKNSKVWIYRFWKSLLYKWSSDSTINIVIATSQIDYQRLRDIADISLLLRATSQIISLYIPYHCDDTGSCKNLGEVKTKTLSKYNPSEQIWIEYEIFNKIIIPKYGIGCNFIAGVMPNNKVEIMLTSCRFHGIDFDSSSIHSVQFMEMSELQFDKDFISTLQS